jgi:cytochrome P450
MLRHAKFVLSRVARIFYNLFFHPLRSYPGSVLDRATRLNYVYLLRKATLHEHILEMHNRYGTIVRIAPDELSIIDPQAWKDLYRIRPGNQPPKDPTFYNTSKKLPPTILNTDDHQHGILRRALNPGFSDKSLRAQEPMILHYVDLLVQRLAEVSKSGRPANMTEWFSWTTFDIIGDLAMGQSFGCLEGSGFHPWVRTISALVVDTRLIQNSLLGMQWLNDILITLGMKIRKNHLKYVEPVLEKRRQMTSERADLMAPILEEEKAGVSPLKPRGHVYETGS